MMLTSSIEASQTIAYYICDGNISEFVDMMNQKAKDIGLTSTNFTNATGLYNVNQYTTARDMATLTEYALTVPLFESIATTAEYNPSIENPQNHEDHASWIWTNSNLMMDSQSEYYYNGAKGIKTGNLTAAGRNVVTIASREGYNYLVVLMKAPIKDADGEEQFYHLEDAMAVFDWAFNHFSYQVILSDTVEIDEVKVTLADGNDYVLARPKEEFSMLWYDEIDTSLIKRDGDNIKFDQESFQAPISKDERLGEVTLTYSGEELGTIELVAVSAVNRSTSKYNLYAIKKFRDSQWFNKALLVSSILCGIYILICIYSFIKFKRDSRPIQSMYALPKVKKKKHKKNNENK
jgi:D-alanyl-D-alanine carboxypeptidase (penicillin-binding protein 5/6)